jgi:hypothetical protein
VTVQTLWQVRAADPAVIDKVRNYNVNISLMADVFAIVTE